MREAMPVPSKAAALVTGPYSLIFARFVARASGRAEMASRTRHNNPKEEHHENPSDHSPSQIERASCSHDPAYCGGGRSGCIAGHGAASHRRARLAQRHHDHRRQATPAARPEIRRRDQRERRAVESVVGAARGAAQGRPERAADHDRRRRVRGAEHLRRRHPDARSGSASRNRDCATRSSTPPRSARRRGQPSSPAAIIIRWASA